METAYFDDVAILIESIGWAGLIAWISRRDINSTVNTNSPLERRSETHMCPKLMSHVGLVYF
jgi:hypothetical protein